MQHEPFKLLQSASLLLFVLAKREGELNALSVYEECCFLQRVLRQNSASNIGQPSELHPFHPPQTSMVRKESLLCPVRISKVYLYQTHAHRRTDQLSVTNLTALGNQSPRIDCLIGLSHWIVSQSSRYKRGKAGQLYLRFVWGVWVDPVNFT